jgi:hypothetical protein
MTLFDMLHAIEKVGRVYTLFPGEKCEKELHSKKTFRHWAFKPNSQAGEGASPRGPAPFALRASHP